MLAITERLVADQGLEWAFCDTDSMAIAKPAAMADAEFHARVDGIVEWFSELNPYAFAGSILRIEDVNFGLHDRLRHEPLHCWAISAKRYVLLNLDAQGRPVLRKASAHGLGHPRAPYAEHDPAPGIPKPAVAPEKLGVELWQHDLWWTIATAALDGEPDRVELGFHPKLAEPAVSRYAATTPKLLGWFRRFNVDLPYNLQIKPFGFLYSLFGRPLGQFVDALVLDGARPKPRSLRPAKPAAPFDTDLSKAVALAFDRETGKAVQREALKSYRQVLAQFHLHPESKFLNGDFCDTGLTRRRRVQVSNITNIGKEADHWEEQFYLGLDETAQTDHGLSPTSREQSLGELRAAAEKIGRRKLAVKIGISRTTLTKLLAGNLASARRILRPGAHPDHDLSLVT